MPYLRLYMPKASVEQKRFIAQNLIDITLRAFHLRKADRCQISIEFVSQSREHAANRFWPSTRRDADFTLEVLGHDLPEAQKRAFSEEATAMLAQILPVKLEGRIASLCGIKADTHRHIVFRFAELSPAISEPFVMHSDALAA